MVTYYTTADGKRYTAADGTYLVLTDPLWASLLITDRTSEDVARWKELHDKGWAAMTEAERAEWLGEMKGRYNYTDMNRVENVVSSLSERFIEAGYLPMPLTVKVDWNRWSAPTKADFQRYFGNVDVLRSLVAGYSTTPATPTIQEPFDYNKANDLEKILLDLDDILTKLPESWNYCGDIYCGEV